MPDFSVVLGTDYLGLRFDELRADGTAATSTVPVTYTSSDPAIATVHEQPATQPPGSDEARVVPVAVGAVTITASLTNEVGATVTAQKTVEVTAPANPISSFRVTQIHP
jgi:uncharacterized protein YjdB